MPNNIVELDNFKCPMNDVTVKTICTARVIPNDETSPLKYGQLCKLSCKNPTNNGLKLILDNLAELTHLEIHDADDETITTLLASELAGLDDLYTNLPNLTHLDLPSSRITSNGLIQLSQSQLFCQLERLDVRNCGATPWDGGVQLPPGLKAILTNSRRSNLKHLNLTGLIPLDTPTLLFRDQYLNLRNLDEWDMKPFEHLGNCDIQCLKWEE